MKLKNHFKKTLMSLAIVAFGFSSSVNAASWAAELWCAAMATLVCGTHVGCWDEVFDQCMDTFKTINNTPPPCTAAHCPT